jgi:hypothetical protein
MQHFRISLVSVAALLTAVNVNTENVVTNWNAIAFTAMVTTGGESPGASGVWFAHTGIAMYGVANAVHHPFPATGHFDVPPIHGAIRNFVYNIGEHTLSMDGRDLAYNHEMIMESFATGSNERKSDSSKFSELRSDL